MKMETKYIWLNIDMWGCHVYLNGEVFDELISFTVPEYFDMFTFPLVEGTANVLNDPNAIIISTPLAEKYFKILV